MGGLALLALVAASGCKDSGLPGRNTPQAEAEQAAWSYPAYEAGKTPAVHVGGEDWLVAGPPIRIPAALLVSAGQDGDREVFALAADPAPYTRLYVLGASGYSPLARAPKQGEVPAAAH
jgi:hypothetical protein